MQKTCCASRPLEAYCEQVNICTEIALSCMEIDRHKRPTIADIIHQLNDTEAVIEQALSLSASSHSLMQGDLLKVQTFTRSEAIPGAESCTEFPVLLQVTAPPWPPGEEVPRTGVDIVAVLDIDRRVIIQWKQNLVKQAMMIVIEKLGPNDRLSIVSFDDNAHSIMKLTSMSQQGRDVARLMVNKLTGSNSNNIVAGLREGAEILRAREVEEGDSRVGCIMLVSDGKDKAVFTQDILSSEFPVHTFGLHNIATYSCEKDYNVSGARAMKYIAHKTSGIYSYVDEGNNSIKEAFEQFITGITSVGVTSVKISIAAHESVTISSIESGGHGNEVSSDKRSGEIHINDIYAGETKNFIIYLAVIEGNKKLLTVGGRYLGFSASKQLRDMDVFVLRPRSGCSTGKLAIHSEVAAELVRIQLEKALSERAEQRYVGEVGLQDLWNSIRYSDEGRSAPAETLSELGKDMAEIKRYMSSPHWLSPNVLPYLLSWLSCHKWQRATSKGSRSNSGAFSLAQYTVSGKQANEDEE